MEDVQNAIDHHNAGRMSSCFAARCTMLACLAITLSVAGCGSVSGDGVDRMLQTVGLQKPPVADNLKGLPAIPTVRSVTLRLHAGAVLNTDAAGRPLALVVKIYRLKHAGSFLQKPYESFHSDTNTPSSSSLDDVIAVREVVMAPGQHFESVEKLGMDVAAIAVVGLFRAPHQNRWRFAFDTASAAASGVTLGLHGCAMSVAQGQPLGAAAEQLRVAGVKCL